MTTSQPPETGLTCALARTALPSWTLALFALTALFPLTSCVSSSVAFAEAREPVSTTAANVTVREITERLHRVKPGERADFANRGLTYLDLSGLDFKGARLAHSDFYGVDFTGANLSSADLSHTRLDRSTLIDANPQRVNFTFSQFNGADFTNANMAQTSFTKADLRGANLASVIGLEKARGLELARNLDKAQDVPDLVLKIWNDRKPTASPYKTNTKNNA